MTHRAEITPEMQEAIQICEDCHHICTETTAYSLRQGGKYAESELIGLLLDCSQLCAVSADYMIRLSHFYGRVCDVCSAICRRCADACERVGPDDPMMKRCVDICQRCAESCRRMAEEAS